MYELGQTQTGPEVVREHLARYIDQRNQQGADPKAVVVELFAMLQAHTVPPDHPCAGVNGRNVCTMTDIIAAIGQAPLVAAKREEMLRQAKKAEPWKIKPLTLVLVVGGAVAAWALLFLPPPKGRRR